MSGNAGLLAVKSAERTANAEYVEMYHDVILQRGFDEVHHLTAQLRGIRADAVPLRRSLYSGVLSTVDFGDITLQVVHSAPMLLLGISEEGTTSLIQVLEGTDQARWNGLSIEANDVAICCQDRPHEANYPDEFACAVLSFRTGADSALDPPVGPNFSHSGPGGIVHADPETHLTLAVMAEAVEQATAQTPSLFCNTEARHSLRASALDIVRDLLTPAGSTARRHGRDSRTRQRIIHKADEYLRANPARAVYTDELCVALGTSATRLHQAFHATFGVSPHRYLKMRRMAMVRSTLLSRTGPWHSVKAAALSYGFWHLGQFAHDYRAMYGESPSQTLARVLPTADDFSR